MREKKRLKPALYETYSYLCVLGNDLPEKLRRAKYRHFLEATISKR